MLGLFLCFFLYKAYSIYMSQGSDASELYLSGGIQAHLFAIFNVFAILSVLVLSFRRMNKVNFVLNSFIIFVSICYVLLYSTKSAILYLFLSFFIAGAIYYNRKIKLFQIVFILLFGFLTFFISYSLIFERLADLDFLINHISIYYFSGVGSLSAYIENHYQVGLDPYLLFRPIENIVNILNGDPLKNTISSEWTYMGGGTYTNVKSFFGTIYLYGGLYWGIFTVLVYSFVVHFIFFKKTKRIFLYQL